MQEYLTVCFDFSSCLSANKKATLLQILVEIRRQLFQTATWFKSPVFRIKSVCVWQTFSGFLPLRSLLTLLFQPLRQDCFGRVKGKATARQGRRGCGNTFISSNLSPSFHFQSPFFRIKTVRVWDELCHWDHFWHGHFNLRGNAVSSRIICYH